MKKGLSTNQWLLIGVAVIFGGLSLLANMFAAGAAIIIGCAVLVWFLGRRAKPPENIKVLSARCRQCGNVGEPHWARCAKCGATNWKEPA